MRAAIGLGSNLGDRDALLDFAVAEIGRLGRVVALSSRRETEPVGGPAQGPYRNAALLLETDLSPRALLAALLAIEARAGRERAERWGPRTLDLDLLLCEERVVDEEGLAVPHPRLFERRFVLEPLAEIAPRWRVPPSGRTVEELLADLPVHS